jgi:Ca-activated chloride channel family protein
MRIFALFFSLLFLWQCSRQTESLQREEADAVPLSTVRNAPPPPPPPPPPPAVKEIFFMDGQQRKMAPQQDIPREPLRGDSYAAVKENDFILSDEERFSTFSIDVDAASYSNVRRFLNEGNLPPADAVRSEEMINYFRYSYPQPTGEHPFYVATELSECPWNPEHQLLMVGMKGQNVSKEELPAANFVFLLDVSGSMNGPDRLGLLQSSLLMLTDNLREQDKVAIVVYAGAAGVVLEPTSGADKNKIAEALKRLQAGGSTAGAAGIKQAYELARANFVKGGNNRVILATDGDFNVGISSNEALEAMITEERENGIFLSVLGFGRGNLQDDKMEMLADKGNGNYAYIDQLNEARKVLVSEFGGTLFTIAKDVKIQLEFDPAYVRSYRLIGYENRLLDKEDFRDDTKDAGELGAGHTVTALYEIVPAPGFTRAPGVGMLRLRYKAPDSDTSQEMALGLGASPNSFGQSSINLRWAAAVAEFSMLLKDSAHKGNADYEQCTQLARQAQGRDPFGYRREMIELIGKAQSLATAVADE